MSSNSKVECRECPFSMYCKATLFALGFYLGLTVCQSLVKTSLDSLSHYMPKSIVTDAKAECGSSDVLCEALG